MRPFIFGERNGIHIIDLDQTLARFQAALDFIQEIAASGGSLLFVGTKQQAQAPVRLEAERASQFYVNNRWLGGMLTNFRTVRKSIDRYKSRLAVLGDEEKVAELSKKERSRLQREAEKYRRALEGIREMSRLPDAMFVIDINREHIAVSEARRLDIPIVAVVDTNCDPQGIDFPIPGNDDAIRAIQLYCNRAADACLNGAQLYNERIESEVSEEATAPLPGPPVPATGRVVVEIKQPPRRGRGGTRSAGGRRGGRAEQPEPVEAPPVSAGKAKTETEPTPEPKPES
jgi:small subunit ribosomal protein S2